VDNDVHTLQKMTLSRIPAMFFGIALKICTTKKHNRINSLSIDTASGRGVADVWLGKPRQLCVKGQGAG
jgi:hypothetical protein